MSFEPFIETRKEYKLRLQLRSGMLVARRCDERANCIDRMRRPTEPTYAHSPSARNVTHDCCAVRHASDLRSLWSQSHGLRSVLRRLPPVERYGGRILPAMGRRDREESPRLRPPPGRGAARILRLASQALMIVGEAATRADTCPALIEQKSKTGTPFRECPFS
jgi:hypothetical protein